MIPFNFQNHYDRLQVGPNATEKELSKAYRRLAKKHHPDVSRDKHNSLSAFLSIRESYEILSDPIRRKDYDKQVQATQKYRNSKTTPSSVKPRKSPFSHFRTTQAKSPPRTPNHAPKLDINASIKIELEDAIIGGVQNVKIELDKSQRAPNSTETVHFTIPPLCPDGHILTIPGKGFFDKATQSVGNLHLCLKYAQHERFSVRGNDLHISIEIYPWDAATGMAYSIKTPGGKAALCIPAGTYNWQTFTLKGHGMPDKNGRRGNLLVSPKIKQPTAVTEEQKRLWKALRASYGV